MTQEEILALRDRLLSSPRGIRNQAFAAGLRAMAAAVVNTEGELQARLLWHPEVGMCVRLRSRPGTLVVTDLVNHDRDLYVRAHATWDRGTKYATNPNARDGIERLSLRITTWRRWIKGARLLKDRARDPAVADASED